MAPHPLRRLAASGLAYQASGVVAGVLALVTLPLYTSHLSEGELGWAEVLLTWIILLSIVVRGGLQEALLRHWFHDEDPVRRARLARRVVALVAAGSTAVAGIVLLAAAPLAELVLDDGGHEAAATVRAAALGIWAFTNLEVLNALLRAQEARRTYLRASLSNVGLTVGATILLVVVLDQGAPGYLLGNYLASVVVLLGLWWSQRELLLGHRGPDGPGVPMRALWRFGLPTVVPEVTVFLLTVVDRQWLLQEAGSDAAGVYAAAVKLATLVIVVARAFQAAWPPLAYDLPAEEAPPVYAQVVRLYVALLGTVVAAIALLRHEICDLLLGDGFSPAAKDAAAEALPWLALGWALWGLTWVFTSIAGRAHATGRTLPAAVLGLVVNVLVLAWLVPDHEATGAALALVAAYVVALGLAHLRTRRLLRVPFDHARMLAAAAVLVALVLAADALLPGGGVDGWATRLAGCALLLPAVVLAGGVRRDELRGLRAVLAARRA
jgi:O-antigen/teichoic acid export membrane protein